MSGPPLTPGLAKSLEETKVEYTQLGTSGLRVSNPILGTMLLGSKWVEYGVEEEPSLDILKAAYDSGINTWDTANAYGNGASEALIGKALKKLQIPRQKSCY